MRKPDLSKLSLSGGPGVPTMIVPPGTQIGVDAQGQVSIRTPGNLVLQNSGAYGTLHVDAEGVAHVVMQETERLEVGKNGRLVGNFRSEKELFDLFSRFAGQV